MTGAPKLHGERLVLAPVTAGDVPELRRILATPEVRLRWRDEDALLQWPFDDPSAARFAVLMGGAVRGMVQYGEEDEPATGTPRSTSFWTLWCTGAVLVAKPWQRWPGTWFTTGATAW